MPVLWWRSVGSTHTAYATEVMIDELAHAAGKDPVEFRLALLAGSSAPRGRAQARGREGWLGPRHCRKGRFRGVAVHEAFNTFVAQVAEITLRSEGGRKVERVVCAVDCGVAVNPDVIKAQMEGGIGFGLGAILHGAITLDDGKVVRDQLRRLPGAAHRRDAEGRGAHRAVDRAADRRRRAGRAADRPGGGQCLSRGHRQAVTVLPFAKGLAV